jgi:hypothetical protein
LTTEVHYTDSTVSFKTYAPGHFYRGHIYTRDGEDAWTFNDANGYLAGRAFQGSGQEFTLKPGENIDITGFTDGDDRGITGIKKGEDVSLLIPATAWIDGTTGKKIDPRAFFAGVEGITGGSWQQNGSKTEFVVFNGGTWDGGNVVLRLTNGSSITWKVD